MFKYSNMSCTTFDKDLRTFPSKIECERCNGQGGWHDGSRDRGFLTPWGWNGCDFCDEQGFFYNPTTKCINRHKAKL